MGKSSIRLGSLSPLGPIFGKELRSTARKKRTYLLRFLYLGELLLILLAFYLPAQSCYYRYGGGVAQRAQQGAEVGATFFGIFCFFTLVSMCLIGPILTSTAIN